MASLDVRGFIRNRAGIAPSEDALPYKVTTNDAEAYIQKKFDIVLNRAKSDDSVPVTLTTYETGKLFFPFMLTLPITALEQKKNNKAEVNEIFLSDDSDNSSLRFRKELWPVIQSYMYDKRDRAMFQSVSWKRSLEIYSRSIASTLVKFSTAKIMTFSKGGEPYVSVLLDPLRVFHDMLKGIDDTRNFYVNVESTRKLNSLNYEYNISRVISKHGPKGDVSLKDNISRALRDKR